MITLSETVIGDIAIVSRAMPSPCEKRLALVNRATALKSH